MINTCELAISTALTFRTLENELPDWVNWLQAGLAQSVKASNQTFGHLEEQLLRGTLDLQRQLLQEAAQKKADATPPRCPVCGRALNRCTHSHARTFETRFGPVTLRRTRGGCARCRHWRFPADAALGLTDTAGYSPSVLEMAALAVSKPPVAEASAVVEQLTRVKLPRATLDREARRQGQRAQAKRQALDGQMQTAAGAEQQVRELQL